MANIRGWFVSMGLTLRHMGKWLVSSSGDLYYPNPNFNPVSSEEFSSEEFSESEYEIASQEKGVAIYCIHGTADRVSSFTLLAERCVHDMPEQISGFHLPSFDKRGRGCGIAEFAEQLAQKILANGHDDVVVMGHSRGGLVAAYFAEYLAKKYGIRVRAVITMASPFGGSYLALPPLTWISDSIKEMQINSEFLKELRDKIIESESEYFYFAAKNDRLVHHESTHIPEKGILKTLDTPHDHIPMMSSRQLVKEVNLCLKKVTGLEEEIEPSALEREIEMTDFTVVPILTPLEYACERILTDITALKSRYHLWSAEAKITILEKLRERLLDMIEGRYDEAYPEANTIGEYISAFMQDPSMGNGKKPIDILSVSLNNPFGFTLYGAVQSDMFIKDLIADFAEEPLYDTNEPLLKRTNSAPEIYSRGEIADRRLIKSI